jgi:hypothetical protein
MNCSCIKGNYRFNITTQSREFFIYEDISDWMIEEYYYIPEKYELQVLLPGASDYTALEVFTNRVNMISPKDLGLPSMVFSDGIYCFKVDNCGTTYKRLYAFTEKLECGIKKLLLRAIQTKRDFDFEQVNRLNLMIEATKISALNNNVIKAQSYYDYVKRELNRLDCLC